MGIESFAIVAKGPDAFPANFQTAPLSAEPRLPEKDHPDIAFSIFEIWQSMMITPMAALGAAGLAQSQNLPLMSKTIVSCFDDEVFKSYFDHSGLMRAVQTKGRHTVIKPYVMPANTGSTSLLTQGIYTDVQKDGSFTVFVGDAHGKGVSASFKKSERAGFVYELSEIRTHETKNDSGEALSFDTSKDLESRFAELMAHADKIIKQSAPEPDPPGGGTEMNILEAA